MNNIILNNINNRIYIKFNAFFKCMNKFRDSAFLKIEIINYIAVL